MSGLTDAGFLGKRLPQIKAELEAEYKAQFGVDLNFAPETIIGQLIGIESEAFATIWAELEDVYQSQYPSTASGSALDLLVAINGLARLPAAATSVSGYLTITEGTTVSVGRKAKDGENIYTLQGSVTGSAALSHGAVFGVATVADATDYTITIDGAAYTHTSGASATVATILAGLQSELSGISTALSADDLAATYDGPVVVSVSANLTILGVVMEGTFQGDVSGPISLPIAALDEIETPVAGWAAVTNRAEGSIGSNIETDGELRIRQKSSVRLQAISTIDGITAQLLQTAGVLDALVFENSGEVVNADGVPPQHIWCIVDGGSDADIAGVIFKRHAGGIGTFGDTTAIAYSEVTGQPFNIKFGRPDVTPAYITVNIAGSSTLPSDYVALVRAALVGFGDGLSIGENLILNRLFTPPSLVLDDESYVSSITLGLAPSPVGTANLIAATDERFQITSGNIDVLLV